MIETLIGLVIAIVIIGVVLYLLNMLLDVVPMDPRFKQIGKVLVIAVAVIIILVYLMRLLPAALP